jgi:hypothetical protein
VNFPPAPGIPPGGVWCAIAGWRVDPVSLPGALTVGRALKPDLLARRCFRWLRSIDPGLDPPSSRASLYAKAAHGAYRGLARYSRPL